MTTKLAVLVPALAVALAACYESPTASGRIDDAAIRVTANVSLTEIDVIVITVSATDIDPPLIFNISVVNGVAQGTLQVPAGPARTFDCDAYDATGQVTHEGSTTVDVQYGANPPLSITLLPRSGQVPVELALGEVSVVVSPATATLVPEQELQLSAIVTASDGSAPSGSPLWATSDPSKATVDQTGMVTAVDKGQVQIMAVFAGVGGTSVVEIVDPVTIVGATITAGDRHTCGLTVSGAAYCWGHNANGQLGDGTITDRLTPVAVSGGLTFTQLSAGDTYTVGLTPAGEAYAWGNNTSGRLGDGTGVGLSTSPVAVAGGLTFTQLSTGAAHTVALTSTGEAYAWGSNTQGQLGDGTFSFQVSPVAVSGGFIFTQVSAGGKHTVALAPSGEAYAWGSNGVAQLGDGTTTDRLTPVAVSGGLTFTQLSAGGLHTLGLTPAGEAYAWGSDANGRLGTGSAGSPSPSPVAVSGGLTFTQLSAGDSYSIGLTTTGEAYAWGSNDFGQLGDGTTTDRVTPVAVVGGLSFAQLSAGQDHTVGVTTTGEAYAWGFNGYGQLGDGTSANNRLSPVAVSGGLIFK